MKENPISNLLDGRRESSTEEFFTVQFHCLYQSNDERILWIFLQNKRWQLRADKKTSSCKIVSNDTESFNTKNSRTLTR